MPAPRKKTARPRARKAPVPATQDLPVWIPAGLVGMILGMALITGIWVASERLRVSTGMEYSLKYSPLLPAENMEDKAQFVRNIKKGLVPLGRDKSTVQAVNDSLHHNNARGFLDGLPLIWVKDSTRVLVVRADMFYAQVMVMQGRDKGKMGWVRNEFLTSPSSKQKTPSPSPVLAK